MIEVLQIFRKKDNNFFSLENVFSSIRPYLNNAVSIEKYNLHTRAAGLNAILKNLFYLNKQKDKAKVFHITGDVHYSVFAFPRSKTILTIHDCVFLQSPSPVKRWLFKKLWLQWPVKYSRMITTISEATRKEVISNTGCDEKKIVVIPDPLSKHFSYVKKTFNKERPVILQIGTWPNKNLERVAVALKGLSCKLSIIGKLSDEQKRIIAENNIDYSNHFHLSDQELVKQYADADIVVFASTFEGFGLPVIEAQAMGRPLITSNISPMKEVAGEAACFVNPFEINSIRKGIMKVIEDDNFRETIIVKGFENVKKYDPEKIADQYLFLYKKIMVDN
jgi:glycosyltransferase involved in cell wall biosynthesis